MEKVREWIKRSRIESAGYMKAIREAKTLTYSFMKEELYCYVTAKYFLDREDCSDSASFDAMAELSLARSMKVSPELVAQFDRARSCDGATSVMAKKVLLFMAIQRELQIEIPADESARLGTMEDLALMIWHTLEETPLWKGRLEGQNEQGQEHC